VSQALLAIEQAGRTPDISDSLEDDRHTLVYPHAQGGQREARFGAPKLVTCSQNQRAPLMPQRVPERDWTAV